MVRASEMSTTPTKVFLSYAHRDEEHKATFRAQLIDLVRRQDIELWDDRELVAGDDWLPEIRERVETCDVAVLLVSSHFLESEFIYSEDVARLSEWALKDYEEAEPIIFSTSEETCIKELVEMVAELLRFKGKLKWQTDKPDGQFRKPSDNSKLKKYLPDFKYTPLFEGLKKTVDWFEEHYPEIRTK